jgi:beta-lactamase regulating signal transducer with metallopeptidase domain
MTLPYFVRLVCLALAAFFLIHMALCLAISLITPTAIRLAQRMTARSAARFLLGLRLFPAGFALLVVAGVCVPSYLWLEPETNTEEVGFACIAAALLGIGIWSISIARVLRAMTRSIRFTRSCENAGRKRRLTGETAQVSVIEGAGPLLVLAGILRPRLVVSREVLSALTADQLAAAFRHERAHRTSRDNLKRFLILLSPAIFPFFRGFGTLDRAWAKFTEWAADDQAVDGSKHRSLALAEALVRVARIGVAPQPSALLSSLVADTEDLSARVDRLLHAERPMEKSGPLVPIAVTSTTLVLAGLLTAVMLDPAALSSVHQALEQLIR